MTQAATMRVLVTGGHKRIGRALVGDLRARGAQVAFTWRTGSREAAQTAEQTGAWPVNAELTDSGQVHAAIAACAGHMGGIDAVVCCAANYHPTPLADWQPDAVGQILINNAAAQVQLVLAALPYLRQSADGRAVLFGDLAAHRPYRGYLGHSMAKAALHNAVLGLAAELGPAVLVNGVAPGPVLKPADDSAASWAKLLAKTPCGPLAAADPELPVRAACDAAWFFLTCARFVSGQILAVDGGRAAAW